MKRKKNILLLLLLVIGAGAYTGYFMYNKEVKGLKDEKADLTISATDLIKKFETDEAAANKELLGKKGDFVIDVTGNVKEVVKDDKGNYSVVLGNSSRLSSVRCSIDSLYREKAALLPKGSLVTIKGDLTGFIKDDLGIGSDVILNRCVIVNKK